MQQKPIVSIMLDTRKEATGKGLYSIKLRATFSKIVKGEKVWYQKYYSLKRYVSRQDYEVIRKGPRTYIQKEIRKEMIGAEEKANRILDSHSFVTEELFDRLYNGAGNLEGVAGVFDIKISELEKEGRIGSKDLYSAVKNSMLKFSGGVTFPEVTKAWLNKYAAWIQSHDDVSNSPTTAGIYIRHLRAIYNLAIELKLVNRDLYPFGKGGYLIKKSRARKIALSEVDKNRLLLISDPELKYAVDMWTLSYYCYGLNTADIALLKVKDLKDDLLIIGREKTKNTDSDNGLVIPIRQEVKDIILRWGYKTLNPESYVFPILEPGLTPKQMRSRTKDFTKRVNTGLKKVGELLGLEKLTTYTARHTFAMMARRKGASDEFIRNALGHALQSTTDAYLDGFDVEEKRAISDKL